MLRYAVAHLKSDPDRFRELALQVVARFPTSPSAAEALYNLADASSNLERRGYLDRLRASYPVDRFTHSASAMNMLYADLTEPSEALALARDMAQALPAATFWRPRVAAQEAMTHAKTLIGGGQFDRRPRAAREGSASVRQPRHDVDAVESGSRRRRGQSGAAYKTLVESAAASPDARVDAALAKYAADLGKTSRDVDADVWSVRDARATPAAAFTLPSLRDGAPVQLADFRGRVVLLAFWYPT